MRSARDARSAPRARFKDVYLHIIRYSYTSLMRNSGFSGAPRFPRPLPAPIPRASLRPDARSRARLFALRGRALLAVSAYSLPFPRGAPRLLVAVDIGAPLAFKLAKLV